MAHPLHTLVQTMRARPHETRTDRLPDSTSPGPYGHSLRHDVRGGFSPDGTKDLLPSATPGRHTVPAANSYEGVMAMSWASTWQWVAPMGKSSWHRVHVARHSSQAEAGRSSQVDAAVQVVEASALRFRSLDEHWGPPALGGAAQNTDSCLRTEWNVGDCRMKQLEAATPPCGARSIGQKCEDVKHREEGNSVGGRHQH